MRTMEEVYDQGLVPEGGKVMPMQYKVDVVALLKEKGYNTNKIRKEKIMGEAMLQKLRSGQMVSWATMETICELLKCQPGDLVEYVPVQE